MKLRDRLFLGFAAAVGLALPVAVGIEYNMTRHMYRDSMLQQSGYVAELLEEKLVEPLDEIEQSSKSQGQGGHWQQAKLDLRDDLSTAWVRTNGTRQTISLQSLLAKLQEVPLLSHSYGFLLDTHGTFLACLSDGQVIPATLSQEWTSRAFSLQGTDRAFLRINDPLEHKPSDLVLLLVPRVGLAVGIIFPEQELQEQLKPLATAAVQMTVVLLLLAWLLCYWLARRVTAPLEELTEAVRRVVKGEQDVPLTGSGIQEVGQLSSAFSRMRQDLAEYVLRIESDAAEKARVARELELARAIQGNAELTVTAGVWTARGTSSPAREVGGDFMDIVPLEGGGLGLLVGDVSGKGIPAALYTVLARSALKLALRESGSCAEALARANSLLFLDNSESNFVSALVAVLTPERQEMVWSRAGHPSPLGEEGALSGPNGPPLGLVDGVTYQETRTRLEGRVYLLYTDGFPEAENENGDFLGMAPLRQALANGEDIWRLLERHRGEAEPSDDATAILLYRGS